MSRIGRMPIAIPAGVTVEVAENNKVTVKGPNVRMPWKRAGRILTKFWITGRNIRRPLFMVIPPEHGDRKRRTCS